MNPFPHRDFVFTSLTSEPGWFKSLRRSIMFLSSELIFRTGHGSISNGVYGFGIITFRRFPRIGMKRLICSIASLMKGFGVSKRWKCFRLVFCLGERLEGSSLGVISVGASSNCRLPRTGTKRSFSRWFCMRFRSRDISVSKTPHSSELQAMSGRLFKPFVVSLSKSPFRLI